MIQIYLASSPILSQIGTVGQLDSVWFVQISMEHGANMSTISLLTLNVG